MIKQPRGFTLIELLIAIAIIAILVLLVVVAIDPVGRLREANDRTAEGDVRATGSVISTCITQELLTNNANVFAAATNANSCANTTKLTSYGTKPPDVVVSVTTANQNICAYDPNDSGSGDFRYQSKTGSIEGPGANLSTCP